VIRQRIGICGLIVLMIAIGIWAALHKLGTSSVTATSVPVTQPQAHGTQVQPVSASPKPVTVTTLDLWIRPTAKVAARHLRRTRFALPGGAGGYGADPDTPTTGPSPGWAQRR
jgi:hypothetical protein